MNVCHVITGLNTGGAEVMLQKLVAATAGNGITHTVVSLIDRGPIGDALAARGIRVEALGMRRGVPDVRGLVALRALIGQCRPQVVQTWMYHANLLGGAAARLAGVRAVVWNIRAARLERSSEKRSTIWIARQSGKVARYLCCRIVTNSEDARHVHEQMGYPSRLFAVIPNGFDLATFRPDANARREVRAELGLVPEAPLIGMVSRFHPGKEHRTFVEAAEKLAASRPDVYFLLAGDGINAKNAPLAQWIARAGLGGRVHLLGGRTDTPRLFAALDVSTLTSAYESFPNVIGESMACGVPCVVTDVGDSARIVGETGAVVPLRDPDALCAAWASLLDLNAESRRARGLRARERIRDQYSIGAVAAQYVKLYEDVARE